MAAAVDLALFGGLPLHPFVGQALVGLMPLGAAACVLVPSGRVRAGTWHETLGEPIRAFAVVVAVGATAMAAVDRIWVRRPAVTGVAARLGASEGTAAPAEPRTPGLAASNVVPIRAVGYEPSTAKDRGSTAIVGSVVTVQALALPLTAGVTRRPRIWRRGQAAAAIGLGVWWAATGRC